MKNTMITEIIEDSGVYNARVLVNGLCIATSFGKNVQRAIDCCTSELFNLSYRCMPFNETKPTRTGLLFKQFSL